MSKYEKLDALILAQISSEPRMFAEINAHAVRVEGNRIDAEDHPNIYRRIGAFRYTDRRLQALRKAGKIKSTSKGWILVDAKEVA